MLILLMSYKKWEAVLTSEEEKNYEKSTKTE